MAETFKGLKDIIFDATDCKEMTVSEKQFLQQSAENAAKQLGNEGIDCVFPDWLYYGNRLHACSEDMLGIL